MLTIFVLPYQQDGPEKKQAATKAHRPKAVDQRDEGDRESETALGALLESGAGDPRNSSDAKKNPRGDRQS